MNNEDLKSKENTNDYSQNNQQSPISNNELPKKSSCVLVVILLLLVLGLTAFIVCDKFVIDKNGEQTPNVESGKEKEETKIAEVKIFEAVNTGSSYFMDDPKYRIVLPQLTGDNEVIRKINSKILNDMIAEIIQPVSSSLYTSEEEYEGEVQSILTSYNYTEKNDILYIAVKIAMEPWNATGDGTFIYNYTYDKKNNKELNLTEVLKSLGKTDEQINKEFRDAYIDVDDETCSDELPNLNDSGAYYTIQNNQIQFEYPACHL